MAGSQWVIEVTGDNFKEQVIDQSHERPVVVDFWAPWCGPCRALGPLLESLAAEKNGEFILAKVNTDENPELAGAFQVNGIPAVYAVRDGQLVDRFEGLLPEDELRAFIDRLAPSEAENQTADALELEGRDPAAALAAYRSLFSADPDNFAARVGLARCLLGAPGKETEIEHLLAPIDSGEYATEAERIRTVLKLRETPHDDATLAAARAAAEADPAGAEGRYRLGEVLAARGEYLPAMDALLAAAEEDKKLGGTIVRELMVKIFTVIGPRSPEADDYRARLRNLLY